MSKLASDLPQEHIVRTRNQFQLVEEFSGQVLEELHTLNALNLRLREKVRSNVNSPNKRFGFLKHDINDYFNCIPLINADKFKVLLDEDRQVWKTYSEKATEKAQQVTDAYAKLLEEHKRKLEQFV